MDMLHHGVLQHAHDHEVFMIQEMSTSSSYDNDIHDAQHAMEHAVLHHRYNNMALVTMLPSALAERLERVVPGRRWIDAVIRLREMRFYMVKVHFDRDG